MKIKGKKRLKIKKNKKSSHHQNCPSAQKKKKKTLPLHLPLGKSHVILIHDTDAVVSNFTHLWNTEIW